MPGNKKMFLLLCSIASVNFACTHKTDLSGIKEISFSSDIQPIIGGNCTQSGCHSGGDRIFSLQSYSDVIDKGGISAGNPHSSKLYQSVSNHGATSLMPPEPLPLLSNDQLKLIYVWILQGAKNN